MDIKETNNQVNFHSKWLSSVSNDQYSVEESIWTDYSFNFSDYNEDGEEQHERRETRHGGNINENHAQESEAIETKTKMRKRVSNDCNKRMAGVAIFISILALVSRSLLYM